MRSITITILILLAAAAPGLEGAGWWKLHFTAPGGSSFRSGRTGPEAGLVAAIGNAQRFIHGAFYEVSSRPVAEALIDARKRGVEVKLVADRRMKSSEERKKLLERYETAGIGVALRGGRRSGLMHNKFAVIDGGLVWTGSYNPSRNDAVKNNNNAIVIRSDELAGIYEDEFCEMFDGEIFGNRGERGPFADLKKRYHVRIEDTDINAYFSPDDDVERIILKRLQNAKSSIHFMAFSFTSAGIGEMMIRKHKEGVTVRGLFERKGSRTGHSQYTKMKVEGLPVRVDRGRGLMHHKVIVIDGELVIMGSYNFSKNASRSNDENILIIGSREIAQEFLAEFKRLY